MASNSNTPQKVAENFVNGYAIRSENKNKDNWVLKNQNITEDFRDIYRELVEYSNNADWSEGIPEDYLGVPMAKCRWRRAYPSTNSATAPPFRNSNSSSSLP